MNRTATFLRWPAALLASSLVLLSGCGGGGDDSNPSVPPAVVPPVVVVPPEVVPPVVTPPVVVVPPEEAEVTGPGELKEATRVNTLPLADIAAAVRAPDNKLYPATPLYAVTSYRLTYVTKDGQGRDIVASGLVSVPVKTTGSRSPVISYQHGSIFKDADAPSNNVVASEPTAVMASLGFIVVAADYVGFGASRGAPHPYLLSAPTASAVVDLLTAAKTWRKRNSVADNGQLFLVGYSEGGYATMAAHRALQAANSPHLVQLAGAVPGAGPYHLGVTLDALLDRVRDEYPLLGGLLSPGLLRYLGSDLRNEVRRLLMKALIPDDADVTFQSTFVDNYLADDDFAIERDSNVHDWTPALPVRMYHGRDDQTVPYAAATRTLQTMQARGANTATLTNCTATPSSHLGCVQPYFAYMMGQLSGLARDL